MVAEAEPTQTFTANVEFPVDFKKGSDTPPVTKIAAHIAARELRTALRYWVDNPPAPPGLPTPHKNQLESHLADLRERIIRVERHLGPLEEMIEARKAAPGKRLLSQLRLDMTRLRYTHDHTVMYLNVIPVTGKGKGEVNWKHLYQLAQCLPTEEDIPKTPAENTLRAIIALLRNHKWPETEGLTQNMKEVSNGEKQAVEQLSAAVGPPKPVGSYPTGGEPEPDDDDEYPEDEDE